MEEEEVMRLWKLFFPEAMRRMEEMRDGDRRFVHYTSAEAAALILQSRTMLLRNSVLMNDFSEVQYGMELLSTAYNGELGERLKKAMAEIQADLPEILEHNFEAEFLDARHETYLISISEHGNQVDGDEQEDLFGRLSMWRAYGSDNGVAFVFNNTPFLNESNALKAYTSPVLYADQNRFNDSFAEIVNGVEQNLDQLKAAGGGWFYEALSSSFKFAIQSTKHPCFKEEREWRIIYNPEQLARSGEMDEIQSQRIPASVKTIRGIPQQVYAIPFQDHPDDGLTGATIPALIDRVLIGPSTDAYAIRMALITELGGCGVEDAASKVQITGIPLRT